MKKIKFIALALIFACACFVSCEDPKPDPDPNGGGEQPGDNPSGETDVTLSDLDFMQYNWLVTELECPDIPDDVMSRLKGSILTKNLLIDNFGISNAKDYKGWGMNLSVNAQSKFTFFVEYYKMENKKHLLSFAAGYENPTIYTGEIIMSQDNEKIYATFTGKSADGSKQTHFACYITK